MLFESERDKISYYSLRDNSCPAHFHRSTEIMYVLSGEKTAMVNGVKYLVKEGDVLLCPPYSIHVFFPSENSKQIVATIPVAYYERHEELLKRIPRLCVHDTQGEYLPILTQLSAPYNDLHFEGLATCFLGLFLRDCPPLEKPQAADKSLAERIASFVETHFDEDLRLEDFAKEFGYSPNYFSSLFKEIFYTNIMQYVNSVRVQKSLKLLKTHKTSAVYALCGFHSPQQYYLNFKRVYGVSPKAYLSKSAPVPSHLTIRE